MVIKMPIERNRLKLVSNEKSLIMNSNSANTCTEEEILSHILGAYTNRLLSRRLKGKYIDATIKTINEFVSYTNLYPWEWEEADFDEWSAYLYQVKRNGESTQRQKQRRIARFQSFLADSPRLVDLCQTNFGKKPIQICSSENCIAHKVEDENEDKRTAFTKEQLLCLWSYFDEEIKVAYNNKSKNLKTLQRDKILYLFIYYYGLRVNEVSMMETTDFIHNPNRSEWGKFGGIHIRFGKGSAGSPPKRRTVWTISDAAVKYLKWYLEKVRPLFGNDDCNSLFVSERGYRLTPNSITRNFKEYLKAAGLPSDNYSPHCLRHSYISHLSERVDVSPGFIQAQVGHEYLATTQLYTHLSDVFVYKHLNKVINRQVSKLLKKDED